MFVNMTYLNGSKSWTHQMFAIKSWTLLVLYSFNGWTQIVQVPAPKNQASKRLVYVLATSVSLLFRSMILRHFLAINIVYILLEVKRVLYRNVHQSVSFLMNPLNNIWDISIVSIFLIVLKIVSFHSDCFIMNAFYPTISLPFC